MTALRTEVVIVTPAMATVWLEANTNNRSKRDTQVQAFARDMRAGRWLQNGGTIVFDTTGVLLDGQHRLAAVIEAGLPVPFLVVFGVATAAMPTIDNGIARTGADVLKLQGASSCFGLAAALKLIHWYDKSDRTSTALNNRLTNAEMAELPAQYPGMSTAVTRVTGDMGLRNIRAVTAAMCVVYYKGAKITPTKAEEFVDAISSGANMNVGDPRLTLRNWYATKASTRRRTERQHTIAVTIKAWNGFLGGLQVKQLKFHDGETVPNMLGL